VSNNAIATINPNKKNVTVNPNKLKTTDRTPRLTLIGNTQLTAEKEQTFALE
jgi:hypothetical protein